MPGDGREVYSRCLKSDDSVGRGRIVMEEGGRNVRGRTVLKQRGGQCSKKDSDARGKLSKRKIPSKMYRRDERLGEESVIR